MTAFQQQLPNDSASLIRRIEQLERDAQEARAARRLEAATIGRGGITIKGGAIILQDAAGREIGRMGIREDLPPDDSGNPQPGFILRRSDGSVAFTLDDPDGAGGGYNPFIKMNDAHGNIIFQENQIDGWGLSRPTFSIGLLPFGDLVTQVPWTGTNTGDFDVLWQSYAPVWNPLLQVGGFAYIASGSTTGQARLTVNGTPQGDVVNVPSSGQVNLDWAVDLTEISGLVPGDGIDIRIQGRVATGQTGKCAIAASWCYTQRH